MPLEIGEFLNPGELVSNNNYYHYSNKNNNNNKHSNHNIYRALILI